LPELRRSDKAAFLHLLTGVLREEILNEQLCFDWNNHALASHFPPSKFFA
jgi:hypothetical protein